MVRKGLLIMLTFCLSPSDSLHLYFSLRLCVKIKQANLKARRDRFTPSFFDQALSYFFFSEKTQRIQCAAGT